jgi:hypothetical protein
MFNFAQNYNITTTMKRTLITFLTGILAGSGLYAQTIDTQQVFIYCPGEKQGLHIAVQGDQGWQDLGQLCASDYGS